MNYQGAPFADGMRARRGAGRWRPTELAAMILGFIFFWPAGLAVLVLKMWQRSDGHEGDLVRFVQDRAVPDLQNKWSRATGALNVSAAVDSAKSAWRPFADMRSSGNAAFDEWRKVELARLEDERRKLAEAQREFVEHLENLRKARDREEFERFMQERRARNSVEQHNV